MIVRDPYVSVHDRHARLVADALVHNGQVTDEAALLLAEHVSTALDHIPQTVR